jgi:hypothetical protein
MVIARSPAQRRFRPTPFKSMHSTADLIDLIQRKHRVLVQLRDVGRRQMELVAGRDTASLIKLLAEKQSLISTLQGVERELTPYTREDPETRIWPSPEARSQCSARASECNTMLREIVELEKQGMELMTVHRNEIAAQLEQVHAAAEVRSAYQAQR